jgi:Na+-driven multidrug efflux pump
MIVFAILQVPKAVGNVVIGNLRGAGDLKWIMYVTIVGVVLFEIGLNWIVAFSTSLAVTGLWLVHFLDETVRLAVNYWRFKGGRWKLTRI